MLLPRTKLIEEIRNTLATTQFPIITLVWPSGSGKRAVIILLEEASILWEDVFTRITHVSDLDKLIEKPKYLIFENDTILPLSDIRTFIESQMPESKAIVSSITPNNDTENIVIPYISFREYAEGMGYPIDITSIFAGTTDIHEINRLRDSYIHVGQYVSNIVDPESMEALWNEKIAIMDWELFEKEQGDFLEFIRTLALGVGDLFKEDRIAKMMNISRRKVRKYTEILMKHGIIRAVWPFWDFPATELFRHVKIYFSDLSYLAMALGIGYYHGTSRQWVLENFIFLELDRKLDTTHEIRFYRKKSGAEVSFILIDKETTHITPIDVTLRPTYILPQALQGFIDTYSSRIERAMLMNEGIAWQKEYHGIPILILPHAAI